MNVTTPSSEGGARSTNSKTFSPGSDVSNMNYTPHSPENGILGMKNATPTLGSGVRGMGISTPTKGSGIRGMMHSDASTWRQHQVAEPWKQCQGHPHYNPSIYRWHQGHEHCDMSPGQRQGHELYHMQPQKRHQGPQQCNTLNPGSGIRA